jgi:DNA polymerase-3 subunit alpha
MEDSTLNKNSDDELPDCPAWSESDLLAAERELIGFYVSGHPLARHQWTLEHCGLTDLDDLDNLTHGDHTRFGGMITDIRKLYTRKEQKPMASFRIESLKGSTQAVMFPEPFSEYGHLVEEDQLVMIGAGMLDEEGGERKLQILELHPLFRAPRLYGERLSIHLHEHHAPREQLERIKTVIAENHGPTPLHFCILCDDGKKIFLDTESIYHIDPTPELIHALEQLVGEGQVYYAAQARPLLRPPRPRTRPGAPA